MIHLGDITKINGADIEPVDCITAGSPCQDLSVAGKRAGLEGERSGLFMEQIRIIKEMRKADEQRGRTDEFIRPRYMVWENVPGALSSNKGEDFRCVLEETVRIVQEDAVIPGPPKGGGHTPDALWAMGGPLLGEYTMHSFGEFPKEENASLLSQILVDEAHPKYSLSAKACQGILNRASRRGKQLPEILQQALEKQAKDSQTDGITEHGTTRETDSMRKRFVNSSGGGYRRNTRLKLLQRSGTPARSRKGMHCHIKE